MTFTIWYIIAGCLLISMALSSSVLRRLPLTTSLLYLAVGVVLGSTSVGLIRLDPIGEAAMLERVAEIAVIVSLFTAGLKLRMPFSDPIWRAPIKLATTSMVITVGLIAVAGVFGLGLPLGAAILLGGVLAPTDPVLASDVQVENPTDRDRLRLSLTGEAGLNDGTAFPFVMLGLGLLNLHGLGTAGWRWLAVDVAWAVVAGLAIGWALGTLVGRIAVYLRQKYNETVGLDDFLALGLIAFSYGVAVLVHSYGFLSVFAAGLALRQVEATSSGDKPLGAIKEEMQQGLPGETGTDPEKVPIYMTEAVLNFNKQLERICEVTVVLLLGGMLSARYFTFEALWFTPLLFFVIRPVAVSLGLWGTRTSRLQRGLISWFGIRGVGSIYYLMFAVAEGVPDKTAQLLTAITLTTVTVSVIVHGISVTPLMHMYLAKRRGPAKTGGAA